MTITIELPAELEEDLSIEAGRKGVTPEQQAQFFLQLATAMRKEAAETPLRTVVRSVLSRHQIDPFQLALAFEDLNQMSRDATASIHLEDCRLSDSEHQPIRQSPRSILGKYAHIKLTTEDIMTEKRRETEREDRPR